MPMLANLTRALTDRMPKVISPGAHAVIDYATAGSFIAMGIFLWKREKRAAISSLTCGAAELATAMMTDYPGGLVDEISFETHGRIDVGMAGLVDSMPGIMRFDEHGSSRFFQMQAVMMAAVTGLTDFTGSGEPGQLRRLEKQRAA
jgi:hypothetical protein